MFNNFKKITVTSLFIILLNISALFAKEINIEVNGLVCEFCVATIEKIFMQKNEVEKIKIDLDQKKIFINFKKNQNLSDDIIKNIITHHGYNVVKINR